MDSRPTRHVMVEALKAVGVEVPQSATLTQVRALYKAVPKDENETAIVPVGATPTSDESDASKTDALEKPDDKVPAVENVLEDGVKNVPDVDDVPKVPDANVTDDKPSVAHVKEPAGDDPAKDLQSSDKVVVPGAGVCNANAVKENAAAAQELYTTATVNFSASMPAADDNLFDAEDELKKLQIRLEVLKIQQQIRELEVRERTPAYSRRIDLMELDAAVPNFNGDDHHDILKWFLQFEDYANICGYTEKEKCVGIRRRLDGTALKYVNNLGLLDYAELKSSLIKTFKRTISRQEIYRQLRSRTLKPNETCLSYLVAMQSIAARSDIEEQELVDIIIDGIPDNSNAITFLYGASTMDELIKRMDRYEQRRHQFRMSTKNVNVAVLNKPKTPAVGKNDDSKIAETDVRCYNCSQYGHYQSRCQKPKRPPNSCFVCAEVGHFHQNCPKKKSVTAAIVDADGNDRLDAFQTSD